MKKQSTMTAQEFEQRFDEGEDITPFIDMSSIRRPGMEPRRVNVDLPDLRGREAILNVHLKKIQRVVSPIILILYL
jgi:SpoVK/Ycf46/Vps4 family AAA+-type ATPase